jgi:hypothetical protein
MNAVNIHQAEKEKREKAKLENQKKKERDKMERYLLWLDTFKLIVLWQIVCNITVAYLVVVYEKCSNHIYAMIQTKVFTR